MKFLHLPLTNVLVYVQTQYILICKVNLMFEKTHHGNHKTVQILIVWYGMFENWMQSLVIYWSYKNKNGIQQLISIFLILRFVYILLYKEQWLEDENKYQRILF